MTPSNESAAKNERLDALAPALLALAALALTAPVLGHGLTNWDDDRLISHSPYATQGLAGIPLAFLTALDDTWYPLTQSVYCVLHAAFGDAPWPYHAVQWLLFALAAALIPLALETFGVPRRVGLVAALPWLAHPMRVETVAWAADLKDTLSLVLVLAAFTAVGRGRRRLAALAWTGALLAKTTIFPLALLFVALELRPAVARGSWARTAARLLPWLVPALACTLVTAWFHLAAPGAATRTLPGGTLLGSLPTALWLPWSYAGRTLVPAPSQAVYAFTPLALGDPRTWLALALWLALATFALWPGPRRFERIVAALGFAAPFAPVTGLVPLAFLVADRFALVPSLALFVALAVLLERAAARRFGAFSWPRRFGPVTLSLLAAAVLAVPGHRRLVEWKDGISLWEADRDRAPGLSVVRRNLAAAYGAAGRWGDAIPELEALRRLEPNELAPLSALVFAQLAKHGAPPERVELARKTMEAGGKDPTTLRQLADALLVQEGPSAAAAISDALLGWAPGAKSESLAARVQLALGNFPRALTHARAALTFDPTDEWPRVQETLGLIGMARFDEALRASEAPARDPRVQAMLEKARAYARGDHRSP